MMFSRYLFLTLLLFLLCVGCWDEKSDYNKRPDDLKGNIYQVLQEKGEYNYFLRAVDIAGYRNLLDGGGLITVFAPDDNAFREYLRQEYQVDSLDAIPANDLRILVAYHMVEFAYKTDDFLAFSPSATADNPQAGDGSCYKYKTLAKDGVKPVHDPLTGRTLKVYSREKYLPVFSTRLFENRNSGDVEKDYKSFFPSVNWMGDKDKLYVCNAAVRESGITTLNGYLYTLDKVVKPLPTIYSALTSKNWSEKYSLYKKLFDRIAYFEYKEDLSKNYAEPGDSLFLYWHFKKPQADPEIPEIASEWSYHDDNGKIYQNALRYAVNCFVPEDAVLEPYLKDYFREWGVDQAAGNYLNIIPTNAIYHLLQAYAFDKRDLLIPSEVESQGVMGINGEHFEVDGQDIQDVQLCSNGVMYGISKRFEPAVFTHLARPLFQYPKFSFLALAYNLQNLYQQTTDPNNRYTLFIQDDATWAKNGYTCSESTSAFGDYQFYKDRSPVKAGDMVNLLLANLTYGEVADLYETASTRRFYVSQDQTTYFYTYQGSFYDEATKALNVQEVYNTENGTVYYVNRFLEKQSKVLFGLMQLPDAVEFAALLRSVDLLRAGSMPFAQNVAVFMPTNEAVVAAREAGKLPPEKVEGEPYSSADSLQMVNYLKHYFVPLAKNKLNHYLLPGLGVDGVVTESYDFKAITSVDYKKEIDARWVTISWDNAFPNQMKITNKKGYSLMTPDAVPYFAKNGLLFRVEDCFDYRDLK